MEQNTNTRNKTLQLSIFALYMAIICIVTMFTKIPIPLDMLTSETVSSLPLLFSMVEKMDLL